jgi:hypothetical protein
MARLFSPAGNRASKRNERSWGLGPRPRGGYVGVGPLSGTRVIDVSRVLAGPFCTTLLPDRKAIA